MEWYERFGEECIWIHYITYCFMAIAKELAIIWTIFTKSTVLLYEVHTIQTTTKI